MNNILIIISSIFITIGFIFSAIGVLGLYRFKDVYQKQHATALVDTTGIGCIIVGLLFLSGLTFITLKLILLLLLLFFINNTITTLFLRSSYFYNIKPMLKKDTQSVNRKVN
jgi:multicomponent Na+:H+ antiporter subunit G